MTRAVPLAATVGLAAAVAPAIAVATPYSVGGYVEYGNATAPGETSDGLGTGLVLRETDGPIGRLLTAVFTATSVHYDTMANGDVMETITVDRGAAGFALGGGFNTLLELELPLRALGGDTSGFQILYLTAIPHTPISFGIIGGTETMHGRTVRSVDSEGPFDGPMTIGARSGATDVSDHVIGMPVRVSVSLSRDVSAYVQLDFNFLTLDGNADGARDLTRYGLRLSAGHRLMLQLELQSPGLSIAALTGRAEVMLGF